MEEREILNARESELLDRIKGDPRIEFVALLSAKRAVIRIPVELIDTHKEIDKLRHDVPEDVGLLKTSIQNTTGGDTLYTISLWADDSGDEIVFYNGDGAQRLRALKEAKATHTDAQVILYWRDYNDARDASFSANMARFAMTDADVFKLMQDPHYDDDRIKRLTGFQESKVRRLRLVANHSWMADLVTEEAFGYSKAASLIQVCDNKKDRLAALEHTLTQLKVKAKAGVKEYTAKSKTSNIGKKGREKTKLSWWFKQLNEELETAKAKIEVGDIKLVGGQYQISTEGSAQQLVATIGTDLEWQTVLAVENFFGRKAQEVPLVSYDEMIANWSKILERIKKARAVVALSQATTEPTDESVQIAEPVEQHPVSGVVNE